MSLPSLGCKIHQAWIFYLLLFLHTTVSPGLGRSVEWMHKCMTGEPWTTWGPGAPTSLPHQITTKKIPLLNGPRKFTPMLFNSQLCMGKATFQQMMLTLITRVLKVIAEMTRVFQLPICISFNSHGMGSSNLLLLDQVWIWSVRFLLLQSFIQGGAICTWGGLPWASQSTSRAATLSYPLVSTSCMVTTPRATSCCHPSSCSKQPPTHVVVFYRTSLECTPVPQNTFPQVSQSLPP